MSYDGPLPGTLKRKRRRRGDKPALSARLYLDSGFKGDAGVLSDDIFDELYPGRSEVDGTRFYAALTIWTPKPSPTDSRWAILPFRSAGKDERALPANTIRFPAGAASTQSFVAAVQAAAPNRNLRVNAVIEVCISDVVPLPLETVIVSIDAEALERMENMQRRYGGGFMNANGYTATARKSLKRSNSGLSEDSDSNRAETKRNELVHGALANWSILHAGDIIPLPITHPVTHAPAPPAKVLACEPVSQGLLLPTTTVVVVPAEKHREKPNNRQLLSPRLPEEMEGEEDSSLETFYSASEDSPRKPVVTSKSSTDMSNTDDMLDSSAEESNLSDDPDDMISLARPGLSDAPSGLSSALTSATPRPFGNRNGVSTPGSVFSNVTSTTIRGGQATKSKTFRALGLLQPIPDQLLHPTPPPDEDEEVRVFVDAASLARLGCFSGDWARIEAVENRMLPSLSAFGGVDDARPAWRPVKVYSLPESMSKRQARYQVNPRQGRRDSISSLVTNSYAVATMYLSPILMANLGQSENVSLSPLSLSRRTGIKRGAGGRPGSAVPRMPPVASEVTLRKVVTPLSSERALNPALYANLKEHFEHKLRIVKAGDLIAIPVDEPLGRSIYEGESEKDSANNNTEFLSRWSVQTETKQTAEPTGVAWFLIEGVTTPGEYNEAANDGANVWGDAVSIDPTKMTMRQSGDDRRRLPPTKSNTWVYYLGVKKITIKAAGIDGVASGMPEAPQPYVSLTQRRMRELMSVSTSPRAVHLGLPPLTLLLTSTQRSIGKAYAVEQVCQELGMHYFPIDALDIVSESGSGFDTQAQGLLEARCERAMECGAADTVICIRHMETLSSDRVAASLKNVLQVCRVLIATTTDVDKIPDTVRALFTHEIPISAPDEAEREGILKNIVNESGIPLAQDVDLAAIAVKTAALVAGDLVDVVHRAIVARSARLETLATVHSQQGGQQITMKDIALSGGAGANAILPIDFDAAVEFARKNFADAIGAPKIPNVQWSDVGGLNHVKDAVVETIQLPLSRPELFAKGLKKRSGILFYGPPGTGKTLLAKAIATEFSLNFFSVKGPELLNMYIGESEANVRRVFQRARDARPCVVFFDELDSVAPKRGNQGDSGGVMDRIVSQLLAELDGMSDGEENGGGVFVIGATNRPDLLDQALLRPGRFDKMLYLGISDTHEKQATILRALTRKFTLHSDLSLARVAETLPFTFTGADLYALCSDAMLKAVTRSARLVDSRVSSINAQRASKGQGSISVASYFDHYAQPADLHVEVTEKDFEDARQDLVPSVSVEELQHYERVRSTFEGATKKPSTPTANGAAQRPMSPSKSESNAAAATRRPTPRPSEQKSSSWDKTSTGSGRVNGVRRPAINAEESSSSLSKAEEDDFVIRTDKLSLNHNPSGGIGGSMSPSKGKGKGRSTVYSNDTPAIVDGDEEDLYD